MERNCQQDHDGITLTTSDLSAWIFFSVLSKTLEFTYVVHLMQSDLPNRQSIWPLLPRLMNTMRTWRDSVIWRKSSRDETITLTKQRWCPSSWLLLGMLFSQKRRPHTLSAGLNQPLIPNSRSNGSSMAKNFRLGLDINPSMTSVLFPWIFFDASKKTLESTFVDSLMKSVL